MSITLTLTAADSSTHQITLPAPQVTSPAGWTTIAPTSPSGQGSSFSGAGTRQIYVSSSTGSDANTGTQALPVATIAHATTLLRTGFPDQMLLKCGDVWTNDVMGSTHLNGVAASGSPGTTVTGPILIGSYGSGARPLIQIGGATTAFFTASGGGGGAGFYKNLAFIGLEFYCYTRDPVNNAASYSAADAASNQFIPLNFSDQSTPGNNPQNVWIEDCKFSYAFIAILLDGQDYTTIQHGHAVRRNIITNSWWSQTSFGGGGAAIGLLCGCCDNLLVEENFFDQCGYLRVGATVYGPDSIYNHNVYIQYNCGQQTGPWGSIGPANGSSVTGPKITVRGNFSSRSSDVGIQQRCGGLMYNNCLIQNPVGFNFGQKGGLAQYNVVSESGPTPTSGTANGQGCTLLTNKFSDSSDVAAGGPVTFDKNLFMNQAAGSAGSAIDFSGGTAYLANSVFLTGDIAFKATSSPYPTGISNLPGGVVVTNTLFSDMNGANNLGAPEPFPNPTVNIGSYAASIGLAASLDGFAAACKSRPAGTWPFNLTAAAVNNYLRGGYNMGIPT